MRGFILELLKTLGTTAIVVAALAWLTKSIVTHFLSRNIEAYKLELKRESDKEIVEVKSHLKIAALERQIIFSRLHEKRAKIVAKSYALIHEAYLRAFAMGSHLSDSGSPAPKEMAEAVFNACVTFTEYFQHRRIYFSEEVSNKMDRFVSRIEELRRTPDEDRIFNVFMGHDGFKKLDIVIAQLPPIMKLIEKDFRTLLGVITPDESASNK
jgi:hypothetical protein